MPTFEIEQYEFYTITYKIEAISKAEAIKKLFDGDGEILGESLDFLETAEDFGLPTENDPELVKEANELGVPTNEYGIPTIRSIRQIT